MLCNDIWNAVGKAIVRYGDSLLAAMDVNTGRMSQLFYYSLDAVTKCKVLNCIFDQWLEAAQWEVVLIDIYAVFAEFIQSPFAPSADRSKV